MTNIKANYEQGRADGNVYALQIYLSVLCVSSEDQRAIVRSVSVSNDSSLNAARAETLIKSRSSQAVWVAERSFQLFAYMEINI